MEVDAPGVVGSGDQRGQGSASPERLAEVVAGAKAARRAAFADLVEEARLVEELRARLRAASPAPVNGERTNG